MSYNLTDKQKSCLSLLVQAVRAGLLPEEFVVIWLSDGSDILDFPGDPEPITKELTRGVVQALAAAGLIVYLNESEIFTRITLTGRAYEAVDSNFQAPDTSFVKYLTPLADVTNLDNELKQRCLPILGAGGTDPRLWDSVVRTAGVILEERLHDVGKIADLRRVGRELVNDVFGKTGTLAAKFSIDAEREGYRDLYAGMVGVFRNPSAHRLMDPTPEDGGAFVVFVNLLLKMLEDLR